jgi:hypothetical protein
VIKGESGFRHPQPTHVDPIGEADIAGYMNMFLEQRGAPIYAQRNLISTVDELRMLEALGVVFVESSDQAPSGETFFAGVATGRVETVDASHGSIRMAAGDLVQFVPAHSYDDELEGQHVELEGRHVSFLLVRIDGRHRAIGVRLTERGAST